jgi:hypothetical protein
MPGASNPDDPPPYRPGSTSEYVPRSKASSGGSNVQPASYASPVGSGNTASY